MFETYFSIIVSLFIIEVLLSVDNALVNATLAESLPEEKRKKAIRIGILLLLGHVAGLGEAALQLGSGIPAMAMGGLMQGKLEL